MTVELQTVTAIDCPSAEFVRRVGTVLREFGPSTQDSGNVSWLVASGGRTFFVKTAGEPGPGRPGDPTPYFDHAGRVALLRNAVDLARSCRHDALPLLLNVFESPTGPVLVYQGAPGELIHTPRERRSDPRSAQQRFAGLPARQLLRLFDTLLDVHVALAAAGWVAVDLYDGCLLVDFDEPRLRVIDLDTYRRGPSTNDMGRMFGDSRFMAPEEFELGAPIDQRTTVFTLGRLIWYFGTGLTEDAAAFCGGRQLAAVVETACRAERSARFGTVSAFAAAWRERRQELPAAGPG